MLEKFDLQTEIMSLTIFMFDYRSIHSNTVKVPNTIT